MSEVKSLLGKLKRTIANLESRFGMDDGATELTKIIREELNEVINHRESVGSSDSEQRFMVPTSTQTPRNWMPPKKNLQPSSVAPKKKEADVDDRLPRRFFKLPPSDTYDPLRQDWGRPLRDWDDEGILHGGIIKSDGTLGIGEIGFWKRASAEARLEVRDRELVFIAPEEEEAVPIKADARSPSICSSQFDVLVDSCSSGYPSKEETHEGTHEDSIKECVKNYACQDAHKKNLAAVSSTPKKKNSSVVQSTASKTKLNAQKKPSMPLSKEKPKGSSSRGVKSKVMFSRSTKNRGAGPKRTMKTTMSLQRGMRKGFTPTGLRQKGYRKQKEYSNLGILPKSGMKKGLAPKKASQGPGVRQKGYRKQK